MKILVLSDHQRVGGAGIAAGRLTRALVDAGHEVVWAAGVVDATPLAPSRSFRELPLKQRLTVAAASRVSTTAGAQVRQAAHVAQVRRIAAEVSPDVIHVHNIHQFLPPELPTELSRCWPVVWTMHDMWAFTGTCAYDYGCGAFRTSCHGKCPRADRYPRLSPRAVPRSFRRRRSTLKRAGRIAFAAPSRWLCDQAGAGLLRRHHVVPIANCVDLDLFRPMDRAAARETLGLPRDQPLVLAPGPGPDDRKGGDLWLAALARLGRGDFAWVHLGDPASMHLPGWVRRIDVSPIRDERLLSILYNAVDLQVLPTRADNLPNVIVEALACGTPTLGAAVGGVPEAVDEGRTGWLFKQDDAAALAEALPRATTAARADALALRPACRRFAEACYNPTVQAAAYVQLFGQLLDCAESDSAPPRHDSVTAPLKPLKEAA